MEATTFKVGDVVKLKSGSPKMTVSFLNSKTDIIVCYFDEITNKVIKADAINALCFELAGDNTVKN